MLTTLCGFFGGLAVLLPGIGLYGVMARAAGRRVREIGSRIALGASAGNVRRMVLRETAILVACRAAIGLPTAFACTRLLKSYLYGLTPQDPLSFAGSVVLLFSITALADYIPARRHTCGSDGGAAIRMSEQRFLVGLECCDRALFVKYEDITADLPGPHPRPDCVRFETHTFRRCEAYSWAAA